MVSSLPASAQNMLDKELDFDNEGVEKDLCKIAEHMVDWEEKFSIPLSLTATDISDINKKSNPVLQRYNEAPQCKIAVELTTS